MLSINKYASITGLFELNIQFNSFIVIKALDIKSYALTLFIFVFSINCLIAQNNDTYRLRKIVIDAGHGGRDNGASGKNSREKNIALSIALKLGNYIKSEIPGVSVIYTRTKNVYLTLDRRAEIANNSKADLFISIHVNSNNSSQPFGTSTYVMGVNDTQRNMDIAIRENSVITLEDNYQTTYEGFDPNDTESYIMFSLMQNTYQNQSLEFASFIQNQFRTRAGRRDLGVMQLPLLVLWKTAMPSVLIETGFLSNVKEEGYLLTDRGQNIIASAIFRAFREYKNATESRSIIANGLQANTNETVVKMNNINNDNTYFSVQILSSLQRIPISSSVFKGQEAINEKRIDTSYKYFVGKTINFNDAKILQNQLRIKFPDAFIIGFSNGERISVQETKRKLNIK